jgi:hypothetical protein
MVCPFQKQLSVREHDKHSTYSWTRCTTSCGLFRPDHCLAFSVSDSLCTFSYESIKRDLKTKLIYECRCDERLKTKVEESRRLTYTVLHDKTGIVVSRKKKRKKKMWETIKNLVLLLCDRQSNSSLTPDISVIISSRKTEGEILGGRFLS